MVASKIKIFYLFLLLNIISKIYCNEITPLMKAAKLGNYQEIKKILSTKQVNINEAFADGKTALHYALYFEHYKVAELLIKNKANLIALDKKNNTPLKLIRQKKLKNLEQIINNFEKTKNKYFVILIASYNNKDWYEKNLDSVFTQNYNNYTVIYMDDMSTDNTGNLVESYVKTKYPHLLNKFTLIKNTEKRYCLGNYIFAVTRFCPDSSIIVTLDGDDWLYNENVLIYLNNVYKNPNIWLTYGNNIIYPTNEICPFARPINKKILMNNAFRKSTKVDIRWFVHHLRSFYTWLFRKIKFEDFIYKNNQIFKFAEDVAFMLPMIEMAHLHTKFIKKILYVYNEKNPLATKNLVKSLEIEDALLYICSKKKYKPIS